jgi:glutamyl-tRNA reductase
MGEGIAVALHGAGVGDVMVVNRSPERGRALADRINGRALGMDQLYDALQASDVVLTSTGSGEPVITADLVRRLDRGGRPLLFVDIAVPRDVAADVADLPHVTVLDLDDLSSWADRGRADRFAEVDRVVAIVSEEVERFGLESAALQAAPLVSSLRERAEQLRAAELARHAKRLNQLDDEQRAMIEAITRGVVAKLLHEPSVRLRNQAGTPQGERNAAAVVDLFDLG